MIKASAHKQKQAKSSTSAYCRYNVQLHLSSTHEFDAKISTSAYCRYNVQLHLSSTHEFEFACGNHYMHHKIHYGYSSIFLKNNLLDWSGTKFGCYKGTRTPTSQTPSLGSLSPFSLEPSGTKSEPPLLNTCAIPNGAQCKEINSHHFCQTPELLRRTQS